MIEGRFESRVMAAMNAALDQVCAQAPDGEHHVVRKRVAKEIVRCAISGSIAPTELIEAGQRGLVVSKTLGRRSRRTA